MISFFLFRKSSFFCFSLFTI